jgi:hypothetical protein
MSEEETIRRLRRSSFEEVNAAYTAWIHRGNQNDAGPASIEFFASHGWTWREFLDRLIEIKNDRG